MREGGGQEAFLIGLELVVVVAATTGFALSVGRMDTGFTLVGVDGGGHGMAVSFAALVNHFQNVCRRRHNCSGVVGLIFHTCEYEGYWLSTYRATTLIATTNTIPFRQS